MRNHEVCEHRACARGLAVSTRRTQPVVGDARHISASGHDAFQRDATRQLMATLSFHGLHKPIVAENAAVHLATVELRPVSLGCTHFDEAAVAALSNCFRIAELPQDPVAMQPRYVRSPKVRAVTAVRVGGGIRDQPCPHRIQMDVSYELQEIAVRIDEDCLLAPLEQVAPATQASVHPPCIPKCEVLDDDGEANPSDLHEEVGVVRHPAIAVDAIPESPDPFDDERFTLPAVRLAEENRLAAITAQDDVVNPAGDVYSRFPRHGLDRTPAVVK